jgi:two-component system chemotaxis response regulator CheY
VAYNVLIVDDSRSTRELIAAVVEQVDGAVAFPSASGLDALRLLPQRRFDLIITDINMPDINGLELIRFVRGNPHTQSTPLFIVSTESSEMDLRRGLLLGAAEYVKKPFDPDALASLVRRYLEADAR